MWPNTAKYRYGVHTVTYSYAVIPTHLEKDVNCLILGGTNIQSEPYQVTYSVSSEF